MGRVRRKLKSQSGASLMVALLFFVMMAVIGSVILAAASAGMGRVKDEDEGDQERYALYSAAKLVVNAFAGESAFGTEDKSNTSDLELKTMAPVSYYIDLKNNKDADNGELYLDSALTRKLTPDDVQWPSLEFLDERKAGSLSEIRTALGKEILKKYWQRQISDNKNILTNWTEGTTINWEDWIEDGFKNTESEKFTFLISPNKNWTKDTANGKYKVRVELTIDPYFNISGVLQMYSGKGSTDDYVTGQVYRISIPFHTDAQIKYTTEGKRVLDRFARYHYTDLTSSEWIGADENFATSIPAEVRSQAKEVDFVQYRKHVSEYRKTEFYDFKWQGTRQATITTIEPDSDSLPDAGN